MLRRIEGLGTMRLRRAEWEDVLALGRRSLVWLASAGAMFLLCRAQTPGGLAPFAMAFLAAALPAGRNAAALLVGCVCGAINGAHQGFDLRLPVGAAIVLGACILREQLAPRLESGLLVLRRRAGTEPRRSGATASGMKARSPNVAASMMAGMGVLLPGLLLAGDALWPSSAQTAAASIAAVAAAPFFIPALEVNPRRQRLDRDERIGLCLLLGALAAGLAKVYMPLALCLCGALPLALYPCGALTSVGLGAALLMAAGDARLPAMIAAGGAAAQLCGEMPRQGRAASACGVMLTAGLMMNVSPIMLAGAGTSALAAMALPEAWADRLSALARPRPGPDDPQRLADWVRRQSVGRLRALSAAFGDLAEGYLAPEAEVFCDEQALMGRLRAQLCDGCPGYAACWAGERNAGARFLCDLIAQAVALSGEAPLFDGEAPPDVLRRCRRGRLVPERIQNILEDFARARRAELKRGAENRLISAQFLQAQRLLDDLARRQAEPLCAREQQAERAAAAMERAGIDAESVLVVDGRGVEILVGLRQGHWTPELIRAASTQLARAFGRAYAASGPSGRVLRFWRRPRLRVETGVACVSREAGVPSGDSHLVCMLDDERLLALVSDGMGSGEDAARESGLAVRLLGRFLRSGAELSLAVETVNALLINRGGEDMFATMDMLILNLATGEAEFSKLAACPTLIARDREARRVEGGRLPLGILEKVQPGQYRARLMPGDTLLMGSDGAMDAAGDEALSALLTEGAEDMPALAHRVLNAAEAACEGGRRDDMTVICLKISRRGGGN